MHYHNCTQCNAQCVLVGHNEILDIKAKEWKHLDKWKCQACNTVEEI